MRKALAVKLALVFAIAMTSSVMAQDDQKSLSDKPAAAATSAVENVATPMPETVTPPAPVAAQPITMSNCGCNQTLTMASPMPMVATPVATSYPIASRLPIVRRRVSNCGCVTPVAVTPCNGCGVTQVSYQEPVAAPAPAPVQAQSPAPAPVVASPAPAVANPAPVTQGCCGMTTSVAAPVTQGCCGSTTVAAPVATQSCCGGTTTVAAPVANTCCRQRRVIVRRPILRRRGCCN